MLPEIRRWQAVGNRSCHIAACRIQLHHMLLWLLSILIVDSVGSIANLFHEGQRPKTIRKYQLGIRSASLPNDNMRICLPPMMATLFGSPMSNKNTGMAQNENPNHYILWAGQWVIKEMANSYIPFNLWLLEGSKWSVWRGNGEPCWPVRLAIKWLFFLPYSSLCMMIWWETCKFPTFSCCCI